MEFIKSVIGAYIIKMFGGELFTTVKDMFEEHTVRRAWEWLGKTVAGKFLINTIGKFRRKQLDDRTRKSLIGVHPNLVKVITVAYDSTPIPFQVICGLRTVEEQQALYAQGRTKPGKIVTYDDGVTKVSNHQKGIAVDLYPVINGKLNLTDVLSLRVIATNIMTVAKKLNIKINWGGNFTKLKDYPHFELAQ
jgi:peptidoglycan L-alanyl-D-glutamate endopeptidase CwlK